MRVILLVAAIGVFAAVFSGIFSQALAYAAAGVSALLSLGPPCVLLLLCLAGIVAISSARA